MVIPFVAVMGLLFLFEYYQTRRYGGGRKEMIAVSVLMVLATALGVAMILKLPVPNPTRAIEAVVRPIGEKLIPAE